MFTEQEYWRLHELVFRPDYSGYKPEVVEIPNGDGKADAEKRYAHVATKYMKTHQQRADLMPFLETAHALAVQVAEAINLQPEYWPDMGRSALRVLEYPPGAVSNLHEDFDLFTLMLYRDQPDKFIAQDNFDNVEPSVRLLEMRAINPQAHMGQLGQVIGLGPVTSHEVVASATPQHSIVYFVIPSWHRMIDGRVQESTLPSGVTVRDWLNERMARSRTEFKKYE